MSIQRVTVLFLFFFFFIMSNNVLLAEDLPTPDMIKCPYEIINIIPSQSIEKLKKRYQSYYCLIKDLENLLANEKDTKTQDLIQAQIESHNKQLRWIIEEIKYHK